jgi:hypothetical protein
MTEQSPEGRLAAFVARYSDDVARVARAARSKVRNLVPGTVELVYDNYNALVIAFGPTDRASDIILSIALYPRWVSLFFTHGSELTDPHRLLRGSGRAIRHVVLQSAADLDKTALRALVRAAVAGHPTKIETGARRRTIIKSVSAKQRPRRPRAE